MKELELRDFSSVNGGVEIPLPGLSDALIAIAKELYNALK